MENVGRKRRVRFTLPETIPDRSKLSNHVINTYRNGCLVNVLQAPLVARSVSYTPTPIAIQFPAVSPVPAKSIQATQVISRDTYRRPSVVSIVPANARIENLKKRHIVIITDPPKPLPRPDLRRSGRTSVSTVCNRISRLMLVEHIKPLPPPPMTVESTKKRYIAEPPKPELRLNRSLFSADTNSWLVADLIHRWHRLRYREKLQSREQLIQNGAKSTNSRFNLVGGGGDRSVNYGAVSITNRIRSDARRFGSLKMSLESDPNVTTMLRAAREADEELLKIVLRKILIDGISKEALNSTDKSGRTAISYICSTNLTHFLDIILQIPGIDVNKPDNEGNTPLHFAAQAGQADAVNMLITRSRSLQIDAKNCLGFTPLMKAALQGRTRCAKLLLFAGASPVETDYGRGLRAEQWAAFCGRPSCSEMIEKCARARLLDKTQSCLPATTEIQKVSVTRSKTTTIQTQIGETFRAKFRKFLPFGASMKDKQNAKDYRGPGNNNNNTDIVGYLKSATICASGPALSSEGKTQMLNKLTQHFEVPKLEVTPANNQQLIKKYEAKMIHDQADIPVVKASASIRY